MKEKAQRLIAEVKNFQLDEIQSRMDDERQGVEIESNGVKYIAFIRRLTPTECGRLQGVPEWFNWNDTSESQVYKELGNGWQVDTIEHCFSFMPKFDRPIRVWSLFDGMACCHIALKELGIPIESYISSEVDKAAIATEIRNFPDMVQVGDVTKIDVADLVAKYGVPDLLTAGSPCQSFSFSGKMKGMSTATGEEIYTLDRYLELKKEGFQFEGQSYLFWEFMRILTELREYNPNILYFLENVKMLEKWERCLSHAVGIRGVHINSALVSAQSRQRIYWSNFRVKDLGSASLFDFSDDPFHLPDYETDIPQPEDRGIVINDILEDAADSKYYLRDEVVGKLMAKTDMDKLNDYLKEPQFSVNELMEYMDGSDEYADMSESERRELAEYAYKMEVDRLDELYNGKKILTDETEENEFEDEQEG
jgi:site-specific DNA-cytosine methylase